MNKAMETQSFYSDVLASSLNVHAIDAAAALVPAATVWEL